MARSTVSESTHPNISVSVPALRRAMGASEQSPSSDPIPSPIRRRLTEQEAAKTLGVSHRTLQQWRRTGGGPPYLKLGATVRYDTDALDAWAQARTRRHTSDPGPQAA